MRTTFKLFAIAMSAVTVSAVAQVGQTNSTLKPRFSITIIAPEEVKYHSIAKVEVVLTNTSNQSIDVRHSDMEKSERNFNIEIHDSTGAQPKETKYLLAIRGKNQGPGPTIVLLNNAGTSILKPGESLKGSLDLNECFDLQPGSYKIQLTRSDIENTMITLPGEKEPQLIDSKQALVKSNEIIINVVP